MLKKISQYFFKKPDEIGLDNYLILIFVNVNVLFYVECRYPITIGKYAVNSVHLLDIYSELR